MTEHDQARSTFLGLLRDMHKVRKGTVARYFLAFPIQRVPIDPNDPRWMLNPLRTRRDYTTIGRPTFLIDELPETVSAQYAKPEINEP